MSIFQLFFIFYVLNNYLRYILYAAALIIVWNTAHIYVIYLSQKKHQKQKQIKIRQLKKTYIVYQFFVPSYKCCISVSECADEKLVKKLV